MIILMLSDCKAIFLPLFFGRRVIRGEMVDEAVFTKDLNKDLFVPYKL